METVRQLHADFEVQLQRIAALQGQLDLALTEVNRGDLSPRRKRPEQKRPE